MISIKRKSSSDIVSLCGVCGAITHRQIVINTDKIIVTICINCYTGVVDKINFEILIES